MQKFFLVFFALIIASCGQNTTTETTQTSTKTTQNNTTKTAVLTPETEKFIQEYESLNNNERPHVNVPRNINVNILTFDELKNTMEKGTGIVFFGFPTCPWCRHMLPNLFDAMAETGVSDIAYYDPKEIRNVIKKNEAGELITENPGTEEYAYILEKMGDILPEYKDLGDANIKRLYVPFVIVVKNGKILSHHMNTLDDHKSSKVSLTDEQKTRLKEIFVKMLSEIKPMPSLFGEPCDAEKEEKTPC